jgi:group I intron endonuclease
MNIYKFTHTESSRSYIGQTIQDPNRRRLEHISHSKNDPKTYHFHNALKKYGIDAFTFDIIAVATSLEELNLLEVQFIEKFDSIINGFNIRAGGGNKKHNPESIERMRIAQRAAHQRRKAAGIKVIYNSSGMTGKKHSEETKLKMSRTAKQLPTKTLTDVHKENIQLATIARYARNKEGKQ